MTEIPSQGTSLLGIDPELVHANSEGMKALRYIYFRKAVEQKVLQWS